MNALLEKSPGSFAVPLDLQNEASITEAVKVVAAARKNPASGAREEHLELLESACGPPLYVNSGSGGTARTQALLLLAAVQGGAGAGGEGPGAGAEDPASKRGKTRGRGKGRGKGKSGTADKGKSKGADNEDRPMVTDRQIKSHDLAVLKVREERALLERLGPLHSADLGLGMGHAGGSFGNLNDLWAFNPAQSDWTKFESTNGTTPPEARSFHRAAATNDKVYIFGGCGSDGRLADLHEYDLNALKWRQLPSPPEHVAGRGGATFEASSDGRSLLMVAGFAGHETNDILKFDLATEEWEVIPSGWLRPRSVCASMSFQHPSGPCVLIFGGEVEPSNQGHEGAGGFASDLISVDPTNGTPMHLTIEPPPKSLRKEGSSFLPSAAAAEDAGDGEDPLEASSSSRGKGDASFLPSASAADALSRAARALSPAPWNRALSRAQIFKSAVGLRS